MWNPHSFGSRRNTMNNDTDNKTGQNKNPNQDGAQKDGDKSKEAAPGKDQGTGRTEPGTGNERK